MKEPVPQGKSMIKPRDVNLAWKVEAIVFSKHKVKYTVFSSKLGKDSISS